MTQLCHDSYKNLALVKTPREITYDPYIFFPFSYKHVMKSIYNRSYEYLISGVRILKKSMSDHHTILKNSTQTLRVPHKL